MHFAEWWFNRGLHPELKEVSTSIFVSDDCAVEGVLSDSVEVYLFQRCGF